MDRESDIVIHFRDGSWGLIEVKLGDQEQINDGAANLLKIAKDIDEEKNWQTGIFNDNHEKLSRHQKRRWGLRNSSCLFKTVIKKHHVKFLNL